MEPDVLSKELSACPRCGAGVRADAPWCTQCFLRLQEPPPAAPAAPAAPAPAAPAPRPAEPPAYAPGPAAVDPLTAPLHLLTGEPAPVAAPQPAGRAWPCSACGTSNGFDLDACEACGEGFLAGLAGGTASLVLPGVGDLVAMSKAKRMTIALGVVLGLMLLVLLTGLLLG